MIGVSFKKAFANTSYGIVVSGGHNASQVSSATNAGTFISETNWNTGSSSRTTTSCTVSVYKTGLAYPVTVYWIAWGTPAS